MNMDFEPDFEPECLVNPVYGIEWLTFFSAWPSYQERLDNGDCEE